MIDIILGLFLIGIAICVLFFLFSDYNNRFVGLVFVLFAVCLFGAAFSAIHRSSTGGGSYSLQTKDYFVLDRSNKVQVVGKDIDFSIEVTGYALIKQILVDTNQPLVIQIFTNRSGKIVNRTLGIDYK